MTNYAHPEVLVSTDWVKEHLGEAGIYYNCNKEEDFAAITGLKKLGTHNVPPLVGRAAGPRYR